jgi:hypothetical protein
VTPSPRGSRNKQYCAPHRQHESHKQRAITHSSPFGELVDDLAKTYTAPREKILADVGTLLRGLADKKLLEL